MGDYHPRLGRRGYQLGLLEYAISFVSPDGPGLPVYFVAGNHDYLEWYGHVLRDDVGLTLLPDPVVVEIAGRRALITHGDAVGPRSIRSRIERRLVGSRAAVAFVRLFPPTG